MLSDKAGSAAGILPPISTSINVKAHSLHDLSGTGNCAQCVIEEERRAAYRPAAFIMLCCSILLALIGLAIGLGVGLGLSKGAAAAVPGLPSQQAYAPGIFGPPSSGGFKLSMLVIFDGPLPVFTATSVLPAIPSMEAKIATDLFLNASDVYIRQVLQVNVDLEVLFSWMRPIPARRLLLDGDAASADNVAQRGRRLAGGSEVVSQTNVSFTTYASSAGALATIQGLADHLSTSYGGVLGLVTIDEIVIPSPSLTPSASPSASPASTVIVSSSPSIAASRSRSMAKSASPSQSATPSSTPSATPTSLAGGPSR